VARASTPDSPPAEFSYTGMSADSPRAIQTVEDFVWAMSLHFRRVLRPSSGCDAEFSAQPLLELGWRTTDARGAARVAPSLTSYDEWIRQLLALGEDALGEGRMLAGAYLIRAAEFFMSADDPRRHGARQTFLDTVLTQCGVGADQHHDVVYGGTTLSAYRLTPASRAG